MTPSAARSELAKVLTTASKGAFLILGPTMVGKTWLVDELRKYLEKFDKRGAYVHHFVCSSAHTGYEPILDAVNILAKRENWSIKKQAKFFGIKYSGKIVGMVGGVVRRFFPDAIPKETLDDLRKSLDEFARQQPEKAATLEFPRSESSKIGGFVNAVIKKSGRPLIVLVDRLEELPTPRIKLLQMLVDTKPEDLLLVASASSDSSSFLARSDIRELVNSFKRIGGQDYLLSGYSADELQSMRILAGFGTTADAAHRAFEYSLGGRIGLVNPWLKSVDENNDVLKPAADQLVAHYAIQYGRLSDGEKNLVKFLGAVYPRGAPLAVAAACLGGTMADVESKTQGVLGPFAVLSSRDIVLSNAHVLHFLATVVGTLFVEAAYTDVFTRMDLGTLLPVAANGVPQANIAIIPLSVQAMNAETLVREVRDDLSRGAHESALSRLRAWRGWAQQATSLDEEADLLLLEADALGQLGAYREAITVLDRVPAGSAREVEVAVSSGEKYWRAGEQNVALRRFAVARQRAQAARRQDAWLKAATRTVAVKNEMREGTPSARLAAMLAEYCDTQQGTIPDRDRCLVYRTVARTLALVPSERAGAEKYARLALDIALNFTKSARDEGNARYALGDVLRHLGRDSEATAEFEAAKNIAEKSGNFDLSLYSVLAMAACAISSRDLPKLNAQLAELNVICGGTASPESKIVGLFSLVNSRLRGEQVPFIDPASSVSGRPWTTRLLKLLVAQGDNALAIQSATIVL